MKLHPLVLALGLTPLIGCGGGGGGSSAPTATPTPVPAPQVVTTTKAYTAPFMHAVFKQMTLLDITEQSIVTTLDNGDVKTDTEVSYTTTDGIQYGLVTSSDLLKTDGTFTRTSEWDYDFNLDDDKQFSGNALDIGTRTANGETFLVYGDEAAASLEGGDNGSGRSFDDVDFSSRTHPSDLSLIDFIATVTVTWQESDETKVINTDFVQYITADFDYENIADATVEYSETKREEVNASGATVYREQIEDWDADGSTNQITKLTVTGDNQYSFIHHRPVWANPTDGIDEEYADFNFVPQKMNELTSYWYETTQSLDAQGTEIWDGKRYVLDQANNSFSKLIDENNPQGLLFHEYFSTQKAVSDIEKTEAVTWTHYPLDGYNFTVATTDSGQAYKVFQKQANDIWVGYNFAEWGSQNTEGLVEKIETARVDGKTLSEIDESVVAGLNVYNEAITTPSFAMDEAGTFRSWYFISNHSFFTDGQYELSTVTLADNSIKDGWLVFNGPDSFFLAEPITGSTYQRHWLGIDAINTDVNNFMWSNWLGEFYLDQAEAEARLAELQPAQAD